jgi:hypothetical protein
MTAEIFQDDGGGCKGGRGRVFHEWHEKSKAAGARKGITPNTPQLGNGPGKSQGVPYCRNEGDVLGASKTVENMAHDGPHFPTDISNPIHLTAQDTHNYFTCRNRIKFRSLVAPSNRHVPTHLTVQDTRATTLSKSNEL